ncbi:MAG: hypothetical protein U1G07_16460 [Verrucomicrobiota bacterium]
MNPRDSFRPNRIAFAGQPGPLELPVGRFIVTVSEDEDAALDRPVHGGEGGRIPPGELVVGAASANPSVMAVTLSATENELFHLTDASSERQRPGRKSPATVNNGFP